MATKNQRKKLATAPAPAKVKSTDDTGESQAIKDAAFNSTQEQTEFDDDDMVTAIIPKSFQLTLDNHAHVSYEAGTQDMPREHAEHWFAVAMGVEIYGE
jgi:hypothetical protein